MTDQINPLWKLADEFSIREAAALISGYDPGEINISINDSDFRVLFEDYYPAEAALRNVVKSGRLKANIKKVIRDIWDAIAECYVEVESDEIDVEKTTIFIDDLKLWLKNRGFTDGFFFEIKKNKPGYLNPAHPNFAPKLAAAINAWLAVNNDPKYLENGKTPKQNIVNWLTANAGEYDLLNDDGSINKDAINNQISKVVNWQDKGGAPKTLGS